MSWQDIVNGVYECLGGVAILGHCVTLYRDKQVRGVSVASVIFFTTWGYWNLYYYPHLNQTASFIGGLAIVAANSIWLCQMWYYSATATVRKLSAELEAMDSYSRLP